MCTIYKYDQMKGMRSDSRNSSVFYIFISSYIFILKQLRIFGIYIKISKIDERKNVPGRIIIF